MIRGKDDATKKGTPRMQSLETQMDYRSFLDQLKRVEQRVLLLDYDGTLAPFRTDREHAFPYPGIPYLVSRIASLGTRVALVSGRRAEEVATLSGIRPLPEIWGSHGLERLTPDGKYSVAELEEHHLSGLYQAALWLSREGLTRAAEFKPGSVAAHWRGMTAAETIELRRKILHGWLTVAEEYQLELLDFDGGVEIRVPGHDKGQAVETILHETEGIASVAYLGDDQTDEDAFQAIKGKGLAVLVREHVRETAADVWLKPPEELIEFLESWLLASGGEQP
jgi:trehalose 6-phosphate phosphatase